MTSSSRRADPPGGLGFDEVLVGGADDRGIPARPMAAAPASFIRRIAMRQVLDEDGVGRAFDDRLSSRLVTSSRESAM